MKALKTAIIALAATVLMASCVKYESPADQTYPEDEEYLSGLHHVEIEVQDYGTISLELDADTAPRTVTNFIELAESGFYNGLTFHRIIPGFMIQGGDPNGNGTGGSDQNIIGEFAANRIENNISHVRGVISMARNGQSYNSASSQFFIVHEDSTFLDGDYAGFGYVTDGMDVVDQICDNTPVQDDNGTVLTPDQPVITEIRVID
jgi:peptidyl-prolyl cis-trans isomerase B (cyclophilin B)